MCSSLLRCSFLSLCICMFSGATRACGPLICSAGGALLSLRGAGAESCARPASSAQWTVQMCQCADDIHRVSQPRCIESSEAPCAASFYTTIAGVSLTLLAKDIV